MPNVLNFGSLNIDRVYRVPEIVLEGQTVSCYELNLYPGGKGLNQSIALSKAGATVYHAGGVGSDGKILIETLSAAGVNVSLLEKRNSLSGHAIIQVDDSGQNCIIISPGSNYGNSEHYIEHVLKHFKRGDLLVLQNEIDKNEAILRKAKTMGMFVALNPSPMNEKIFNLPLGLVDFFLVNEHEASAVVGHKKNQTNEQLIKEMSKLFPHSVIVMTLGSNGSLCITPEGEMYHQDATPVDVVDTTAAGDTYTGYFLAEYLQGKSIPKAMNIASMAAAISVSRKGAAPSIPARNEVIAQLI